VGWSAKAEVLDSSFRGSVCCAEYIGSFEAFERRDAKSIALPKNRRFRGASEIKMHTTEWKLAARASVPGGDSSSDKLVEIVSGADQRPFCGGFIGAGQQKSKPSRLFDLTEEPVRRSVCAGGTGYGVQRASAWLASLHERLHGQS